MSNPKAPTLRMSEAEVSLLLANHLIVSGKTISDVSVALDGAQVKLGTKQHFDVQNFMAQRGWLKEESMSRWQGRYHHTSQKYGILIHSQSGQGDVTTTMIGGLDLIVESKKGTLSNCKSSSEYPLLREALGQLLTIEVIADNAVLGVAVPHGERFVKLAARWRKAPLVVRSGMRLLTVSPTGDVDGW